MNVLFWTADTSGCSWYRATVPGTALAALGHTVRVSQTLVTDPTTGAIPVAVNAGEVAHADVIVGQRVSLPDSTQRWQQLADTRQCRLVYELDDNLLDPSTNQTNSTVHTFYSDPQIQANIRANVAVSDAVVVTTEPLAVVMREHNANVVVIPNYIPLRLLDLHAPTQRGKLTIGWAGGPTHQRDLEEVATDVPRFVDRTPNTELHLIGPPALTEWARTPPDQLPPYELIRRLGPGTIRFTPWQTDVNTYYRSIDFHVALAPLRPTVFNRSKSAVRVLEYAALGIPCVASNVGPYAEFVQHSATGFLTDRPHEWSGYLRALLDPATRAAMGDNARALAGWHTIEGNIDQWEKALTP